MGPPVLSVTKFLTSATEELDETFTTMEAPARVDTAWREGEGRGGGGGLWVGGGGGGGGQVRVRGSGERGGAWVSACVC